jgi:hypothetical protein
MFVIGSCQSEASHIPPAPRPSPGSFYVSPTGSASGDGSASRPWDLPTALSGGRGRVQPGDTIWLRGGTYRGVFTGNLNGTAAKPIIVRQYPGERATLLGNGGQYGMTLTIVGSYTWYWGFEVVGDPRSIGYCIDHRGTNTKVINVVVHDILSNAIASGTDGRGTEVYGTIVYNIGPKPGTHLGGYGIYVGNQLTSPTKTVRDNIFFNTAGYGIHAYNTHTQVHNLVFQGNVLLNTGLVRRDPDILLLANGSTNVTFANNYTYGNRSGWAASFNDGGPASSQSITVTGNFFHGTTQFAPSTTATVSNNTFYAAGPALVGDVLTTKGSMAGWTWATNAHYRSATAAAWRHNGVNSTLSGWKTTTGRGATDANPGTAPTGTQVIVRPNAYEAGRAHIIIYNWAQAANVSVDLSGVLRAGQAYTIVNAQNFYGAPVASGVYAGGTVNLPMAPVQSAAPLYASLPSVSTGQTFQVFVVRVQGS